MSSRAHKRAVALRDSRRADYDSMPAHVKTGMHRPGSLNPRKAGAGNPKRKKKR